MTVRPLRRILLATAATAVALAALSGTAAPASADRAVVHGPFAEDGTFIGPVAGQSGLHSPQAGASLGRKWQ